jgi:hypothetical protein
MQQKKTNQASPTKAFNQRMLSEKRRKEAKKVLYIDRI